VRPVQVYADLLPSSGKLESGLSPEELLQEVKDAWASRTKTQLFRSPLISYLYERGWRQGFEKAGFPGIDVEFEEVTLSLSLGLGLSLSLSLSLSLTLTRSRASSPEQRARWWSTCRAAAAS
jgi:hypothetical protein